MGEKRKRETTMPIDEFKVPTERKKFRVPIFEAYKTQHSFEIFLRGEPICEYTRGFDIHLSFPIGFGGCEVKVEEYTMYSAEFFTDGCSIKESEISV